MKNNEYNRMFHCECQKKNLPQGVSERLEGNHQPLKFSLNTNEGDRRPPKKNKGLMIQCAHTQGGDCMSEPCNGPKTHAQ